MVAKKFSLIAAACENMGIGIKGRLPWRLKNELSYFNKMTSKVSDPNRQNAVIMGRLSYVGIPPAFRPLPNRLNIILSRTTSQSDYPDGVIVCSSLDDAIKLLQEEHANTIENIWVVGGNTVYSEAMSSPLCHRIYFTEIRAAFECDTFFPTIKASEFRRVPNDDDIPSALQEENGIQYEFQIYEKI